MIYQTLQSERQLSGRSFKVHNPYYRCHLPSKIHTTSTIPLHIIEQLRLDRGTL